MKRLTASEIVSLFLYKDRDILSNSISCSPMLEEGKRIHNRLGFDQPWLFRRYFWDGKDWWLIIGCPDKIDEKKGIIHELKTFEKRNISKDTLFGAFIQCQIYCWLTGFQEFLIWGHSVYSNKTSKRLLGKYDPILAKRIIKKAIELKLYLSTFAKEYKKKKEEVLKEVRGDEKKDNIA